MERIVVYCDFYRKLKRSQDNGKERKIMKNKIQELKNEKNAVILAHFYAPAEVQEIADYVGDSFYLAKVAQKTKAEILVFCGVSFMAESAKLLNPDKKVLMPNLSADCAMAHMVQPGLIEKMRQQYPDLAVVCYINSTTELKCQSDVCVTSSNAVKIVNSLPNKNIFFIPDENLGRYVQSQVTGKNIILNDGYCPIHKEIQKQQLEQEKEKHPNAEVLTHPECREEILGLSDFIGSTAEMITYVRNSAKTEFIVCTEEGVKYQMQKENPEKHFYFPNPCPCCQDMKENTLEALYHVLEKEDQVVEVDSAICEQAKIPLVRMLEYSC